MNATPVVLSWGAQTFASNTLGELAWKTRISSVTGSPSGVGLSVSVSAGCSVLSAGVAVGVAAESSASVGPSVEPSPLPDGYPARPTAPIPASNCAYCRRDSWSRRLVPSRILSTVPRIVYKLLFGRVPRSGERTGRCPGLRRLGLCLILWNAAWIRPRRSSPGGPVASPEARPAAIDSSIIPVIRVRRSRSALPVTA
jgi:hypothetical protein